MAKNLANKSLHSAKASKIDEFYTELSDIENELKHYKAHFKNKTVLCNCDDPRVSNFFHFFSYRFEQLGLKKLITTCYKSQDAELFSENKSERAIFLEYIGDKNKNRTPDPSEIAKNKLSGNGDFRSDECIALLKKSDIIVTNPPFSLFREYVGQLIENDKKFVIIGNKNAITYKEIFKLIKENKMWIGNTSMSKDMLFDVPKYFAKELVSNKKQGSGYKIVNGVVKGRAQAVWFTNMDIAKRNTDFELYKTYNKKEFPKYDNYDAINVDKTKDIPMDYSGVMGVPITFLEKYNPKQFEILGMSASAGYDKEVVGIPFLGEKDARPLVNGKNIYARIFIKNKMI